MRLIKNISKTKTGAASLNKDVYLFLATDIKNWFPPEIDSVRMEFAPLLFADSEIYKLYITPSSQDYSYDVVGNVDERGYKIKFSATHPGTAVEALEFAKKNLDLSFVIMFQDCEGYTVILGSPHNPLRFVSSHKSARDGKKFNFIFEQEMPDDDVYYIADFKPWEESTFKFFDDSFDKTFE